MEVAAAASYVADDVDRCLKATELRLGLPGTELETAPAAAALPTPPTPPSTPRGKKRDGNTAGAEEAAKTAPPAAK